MQATVLEERSATRDQATVREVLEEVCADRRTSLTAPEAKRVCDAYGILVPQEGLATSADEAVALAEQIGYPVVLKIVSPDILHKTEAKGVLVGLSSPAEVAAGGLNELLQFARCLPILPTPQGENMVIITGAGGSGVLLSDACYSNGLHLMEMPDDLNEAFMHFIPPFGAAGNPVDITGGEPPETYRNTVALGLEDERVHALVLGYWHTIITPPMTFAKVASEIVEVRSDAAALATVAGGHASCAAATVAAARRVGLAALTGAGFDPGRCRRAEGGSRCHAAAALHPRSR